MDLRQTEQRVIRKGRTGVPWALCLGASGELAEAEASAQIPASTGTAAPGG